MTKYLVLMTLGLILLSLPVLAAECPKVVTGAVEKAYPGAKVAACDKSDEYENSYELKIVAKDGRKLALDVNAAGKIVFTEEEIKVEALPAAVTRSLAAKFPGAKATNAVKGTQEDGSVVYEVMYELKGAKKEATFKTDGTFVDEEEGD
jgi:uncharacterized membrane protein YkoI